MNTLKFQSFTLDTSSLWNQPNGPHWDESFVSILQNAHETLHAKFRSGEVGFYDWPIHISQKDKEQIQTVATQLKSKFERIVVFGIGGSHLGPAAILNALRSPEEEESFPIRWLSNIDPASIESVRHYIKGHKTAAIVISKSGGTTETLSGFFHFSKELDSEGYVVITDAKKGLLRNLSEQYGWKALEVPTNVGGRFSVLTAVGLTPIAAGGISIDEILDGAKAMREHLESTPPHENPAYLLALAFHLWDKQFKHSVQYLMPYWSNCKLMADWFVQLWGESLGKRTLSDPNQAVGFTPVAALGTTDQHSLLQLFKEGPNDKVIGFMDVLSGDAVVGTPSFEVGDYGFLSEHSFSKISHLASVATEKSLNNAGVPTYRITLPELNAKALGALLFFFETSCAFAGELYGVNAFNQPGVEEAKKLLRESL